MTVLHTLLENIWNLQFLILYIIFQYYKIYFNLLINRLKRQKGIKQEYKVNQAHLMRKFKKISAHNDSKPYKRNNKKI